MTNSLSQSNENFSNITNFSPAWDSTSIYNYTNSEGNFLSTLVTTSIDTNFYQKLIFFRVDGQIKSVIANIVGTKNYLKDNNNVCNMSDFCGDVTFYQLNGGFIAGYRVNQGLIVNGLKLRINNAERINYAPIQLPEVVITASPLGGGSSFSSNFSSIFSSFGNAGAWVSGIGSFGTPSSGYSGAHGSTGTAMNGSSSVLATIICPNGFKVSTSERDLGATFDPQTGQASRSIGLNSLRIGVPGNTVDNISLIFSVTYTVSSSQPLITPTQFANMMSSAWNNIQPGMDALAQNGANLNSSTFWNQVLTLFTSDVSLRYGTAMFGTVVPSGSARNASYLNWNTIGAACP